MKTRTRREFLKTTGAMATDSASVQDAMRMAERRAQRFCS